MVKVANTSLAFDRNIKLPRYAAAGIPGAWLVDLAKDRVEVYSTPGPNGYAAPTVYGRGGRVAAASVPASASTPRRRCPPNASTSAASHRL